MHECGSLALFLCNILLCIFMVKLVKDNEVQEVETSGKQGIYITMHLYSHNIYIFKCIPYTKPKVSYNIHYGICRTKFVWDFYFNLG